jgi:hypothetical protein
LTVSHRALDSCEGNINPKGYDLDLEYGCPSLQQRNPLFTASFERRREHILDDRTTLNRPYHSASVVRSRPSIQRHLEELATLDHLRIGRILPFTKYLSAARASSRLVYASDNACLSLASFLLKTARRKGCVPVTRSPHELTRSRTDPLQNIRRFAADSRSDNAC